MNKKRQLEKLGDIKVHMLELDGSRFYGSDMEEINIAGLYNRFIDQELKELEGAVESI